MIHDTLKAAMKCHFKKNAGKFITFMRNKNIKMKGKHHVSKIHGRTQTNTAVQDVSVGFI